MPIKFIPYEPHYSLEEKLLRSLTVLQASATAIIKGLDPQAKFAASIEITDRCNAGCNYCYVYPSDWNQDKRMEGYAELTPLERKVTEGNLEERLLQLSQQGIIHLTLVGGEPTLAPKIIELASRLFPIVWIVSNGSSKLSKIPKSVIPFISIDGTPEYHNRVRDPQGFFANSTYQDLTGISAVIVRNINESERGAFVHSTLTPESLPLFADMVDWLVKDIKKLRGIVVSGATVDSPDNPLAFDIDRRQILKSKIEALANKYGWELFPFNQPRVNELLFDRVITDSSECAIARRVISLDFQGNSVGKCILRDAADCSTCVCNMTALQEALEDKDIATIQNNFRTLFG